MTINTGKPALTSVPPCEPQALPGAEGVPAAVMEQWGDVVPILCKVPDGRLSEEDAKEHAGITSPEVLVPHDITFRNAMMRDVLHVRQHRYSSDGYLQQLAMSRSCMSRHRWPTTCAAKTRSRQFAIVLKVPFNVWPRHKARTRRLWRLACRGPRRGSDR